MLLTGDYDDTYGLTEEDVKPYVEPAAGFIQQIAELAKKQISAQ